MRAVIFDLDGVLLDSESVWDEVRRELAERAGRPWPDEATRAMQGMSTPEWSGYLAETVGIAGRPELLAEQVIAMMAERYERSLPLIAGAEEAVNRLGVRWQLGLASSSPRSLIDTVLRTAGLDDMFEVTVSTEEVPAGKPFPAVYQEAVGLLGVPPHETAPIEDSSNGLRSAQAAGVMVIALPHEAFPPAEDALALADARVANLDDLTVELIESLG